jgi:hypothetical protein
VAFMVNCPCGRHCIGADRQGRSPQCQLVPSRSRRHIPYEFRELQQEEFLSIRGAPRLAHVFRGLESRMSEYQLYECPSCGALHNNCGLPINTQ